MFVRDLSRSRWDLICYHSMQLFDCDRMKVVNNDMNLVRSTMFRKPFTDEKLYCIILQKVSLHLVGAVMPAHGQHCMYIQNRNRSRIIYKMTLCWLFMNPSILLVDALLLSFDWESSNAICQVEVGVDKNLCLMILRKCINHVSYVA